MTAIPISAPLFTVIDPATGLPAVGAKVYFYIAGTSTPQDTWADSGKLSTNTNPVILDAAGSALVFIDGSYKIVINRSDNTLIKTIDGVYGHGGNFVVSDADYGDVIVSMSGTVYTIDPTLLSAYGRGLTAAASAAAARVVLGLVLGTNVQAYDAGLQSFSGLPSGADIMPYSTTTNVWAELTTTAYGRALLALTNAAALTAAINAMTGDAGAGGLKGLVPAPVAGDAAKVLLGNGLWSAVPQTSMALLGTLTTTSGSTTADVTIPAGYTSVYCELDGVSFSASGQALAVQLSSTGGSGHGTSALITAVMASAADVFSGSLWVDNLQSAVQAAKVGRPAVMLNGASPFNTAVALPTDTAAVANAIRFLRNGGAVTFDAGTIRVYGFK